MTMTKISFFITTFLGKLIKPLRLKSVTLHFLNRKIFPKILLHDRILFVPNYDENLIRALNWKTFLADTVLLG